MKKSLLCAVVSAALMLISSPALAGDTLSLDGLVNEACENSPELGAFEDRYEAAGERVPQAGAFDDPMLSAGFMAVEVENFRFDQIPMTTKFVGLSQKLPFYGKRALRSEAAGHEADAMRAEYDEMRLMLRARVKSAYYELYSLKKAVDVVDKNIGLMDVFLDIAQTRYSVDEGIFKDVVKAQVERSMLVEKKLTFERDDRTKRAALGGLLGREGPVEGEIADIAATPVDADRERLAAAALKARPALAAARARIEKGQARLELARKDYFPDFTISAQYHQTETLESGLRQSDRIAAMVTVNLPVWLNSKQRPKVREAASERAMAEQMVRSVETDIYAKIDGYISELENDDRILKLYKDVVIPQATEDLDSALAGYEVGRVGFLDLLDSRRTLFEYELSYYMLLAERQKALAGLEAAAGVEF